MTDLLNPIPTQKSEPGPLEKTSPWVMLITLLLLIVGILFTSAMLAYYGLQHSGGADNARLQLSGWLKKGKGLAAKQPIQIQTQNSTNTVSTPPTPPVEKQGIKKFFTSLNDTVKWPKLKLTGFGKGVNAEDDFAIINEKKIMVGTQIGDVKLLEIRTHGVLVELEGEQKILTEEMPK